MGHIEDMADAVIKMVTKSVDSFVKRDLDMAKQVINDDDEVDALFVLLLIVEELRALNVAA